MVGVRIIDLCHINLRLNRELLDIIGVEPDQAFQGPEI